MQIKENQKLQREYSLNHKPLTSQSEMKRMGAKLKVFINFINSFDFNEEKTR